jgi:hypothetical protein
MLLLRIAFSLILSYPTLLRYFREAVLVYGPVSLMTIGVPIAVGQKTTFRRKIVQEEENDGNGKAYNGRTSYRLF